MRRRINEENRTKMLKLQENIRLKKDRRRQAEDVIESGV